MTPTNEQGPLTVATTEAIKKALAAKMARRNVAAELYEHGDAQRHGLWTAAARHEYKDDIIRAFKAGAHWQVLEALDALNEHNCQKQDS